MKYLIESKILDWFEENYAESREVCEMLLMGNIKKGNLTQEDYLKGCKKLVLFGKHNLYDHLKMITDLCRTGVSADKASESLRRVLTQVSGGVAKLDKKKEE